jgi:riboflavin transporter
MIKGEIMIPNPKTPVSKTATILKTSPAIRTARLAIFSALSVVGSLIKIPSPVGSLAFDSFPGFFVALFFGPAEGAIVSGIGHLATAATSGFPLGILHIPIAIGMALAAVAIGLLNKIHKSLGVIVALATGVAINTAIVFPLVPWLAEDINVGWLIAIGYAPFLVVAATLNAVVAGIVYLAVRRKLKT